MGGWLRSVFGLLGVGRRSRGAFGRSARGGLGELREPGAVRGGAWAPGAARPARPGTRCPSGPFPPRAAALGLPEAAVTSRLRTLRLLQSFPSPSPGVVLPGEHFQPCPEALLGHYRWRVRGCCWHLEGGGQGCCSTTSNAQPSQQRISQLQMSVGLRRGNPALGP